MNAKITDIKRFAVHDGDGIRTTVFFKGCPLKCIWCHNPETISPKSQLGFYEHKCVLCGRCAAICKCHTVTDRHIFDRTECTVCGKCADVCPADALTVFGKNMPIDEICKILIQDKNFYLESGGGITLSGGECLLQSAACREILMKMKANRIHTAVDTCGYVSRNAIDDVLPYTDIFLYDIKALDDDVHINCTGHSNKRILNNLEYINKCGKPVEIRIPCIPGCNENQPVKIKEYLQEMRCVKRIRILPYNSYAASKYAPLGEKYKLSDK